MNNMPAVHEEAPVIVVENLSKRFVANEYRPSLRHEGVQLLKRLVKKKSAPQATSEPFWALRDVSFSVYRGESVGIMGHNGAGKSTLFRLLCNISEPTAGAVRVNGHFAPLIALGAGFNLELSGMQNIFMSAAIHGLKSAQISALIPEIVAFAELGEAMHMPVKRYSSGMTARLGFSIAVHTLPDIVFFDEILSVGDAAFQMKCRQRIDDMIIGKRTMLLVSHSSIDVRNLCERALWLDHGHLMMDGPSAEVVDAFEAALGVPNTRALVRSRTAARVDTI